MTPKELNEIAKKLVAQLGDAHKATVDVVPPGWFTSLEMSKTLRKDPTTVIRWLKSLKAETKRFRVGAGKIVKLVPHYRLK